MARVSAISLPSNMRKILLLLTVSGLLVLVYYLFFKPYEFQVNFKKKTVPGDVIATIRIWNRSLRNSRIVEVDSFQRLRQTISISERTYSYDWNFEQLNDSLLKVTVKVSEPGREILNKLLIPFTEQRIERDARELVKKFHEVMTQHLKITRVKIIGEARLDSSFCVCRSLETAQIEKANGMMKDYILLTSFLDEFKLKPTGPPLVQVREWDHNAGTLKFDFCFPIEVNGALPEVRDVSFKYMLPGRALKAEYNGNYITSDRAWYELLHYARIDGYEVNGLPVEYFHNNPNLGIMETEWKADVYLPIK
jgi:hypothetical protein